MAQHVILEALVNLLVGVLFIWTGFFIYNRKQYQLIIDYNVLAEEIQRRVDILNFSKHIKYASTAMPLDLPSPFCWRDEEAGTLSL